MGTGCRNIRQATVVLGEPGAIDNASGMTLSRGPFIDRPLINLR